MPKLRNGGNDLECFTQWIGRKCKNHNPLQELELAPADRAQKQNIYKSTKNAVVAILEEDTGTVVYEAAGKTFAITVREVDTKQARAAKKIAVGH